MAYTFGPALPQLPVLDKPSKHLGLHKHTQEATDALGSHRLAEGISLEDAVTPLILGQEQRVVASGLQEKADKGLRYHTAEGVTL